MSTILFLCTGNSCRSQMAEAWGRSLLGEQHQFVSAGTQKQSLNPYAVQVMAEEKIDISKQFSKTIEDLSGVHVDMSVSVCAEAEVACPYFPAKVRIHQPFDDPPSLTRNVSLEEEKLKVYRRVRDEIREYVLKLAEVMEAHGVS